MLRQVLKSKIHRAKIIQKKLDYQGMVALRKIKYQGFKTYILFINIDKDINVPVGKLGGIKFKRGFYLYIGSAKKGFKSRIKRHLTKNKKRFWHIDHLLSLNEAQIEEIWIGSKPQECRVAQELFGKGYSFISRFGSSDCQCPAHLVFIDGEISQVKFLLKKGGFKRFKSILLQ